MPGTKRCKQQQLVMWLDSNSGDHSTCHAHTDTCARSSSGSDTASLWDEHLSRRALPPPQWHQRGLLEGNPVPNKTRGRSLLEPLQLLFTWVLVWICSTVFSSFTVPSLSGNGHKSNWTNIFIIQQEHNPQHNLKTCYMVQTPQVPIPSSSGRSCQKRSALIFEPLWQAW